MRINQNVSALTALRNLSTNNDKMTRSLDRLSSGFRIVRAADDAAGLVISEGLRSQVGGLKVAMRNAQDGISVVQTAEGALTEVHSILQRMRDLTVQASNTATNGTSARDALQAEVTQLNQEIDRITANTKFNGVTLLDGSFGSTQQLSSSAAAFSAVTVAAGNDTVALTYGGTAMTVTLTQGTYSTADALKTEVNRATRAALVTNGYTGNEVTAGYSTGTGGTTWTLQGTGAFTTAANGGENAYLTHMGIAAATSSAAGSGGVFQVGSDVVTAQQISVSIAALSTTSMGINGVTINGTDTQRQNAGTAIDAAISQVSTVRGNLGAVQNRFEHTIANLGVSVENLSASESRIRDVDMADEMAQFTRHQIMVQSGTAMLSQANALSQSVLSLLR